MSDSLSYEFDSFRLIPAERQLLRAYEPISLPPKAFDTLVVLVQHSGHALKKDDLMKQVWPDSFVEESNLNHNISVLRKALSEGNNGDGYVETVRGYGFRFRADVRAIPNESSTLLVHRRTRTHVVVKEEQSESLKTVTSTQAAEGMGKTVRGIAMLALLALIGGIVVAYFAYIRPARLRNANSASSGVPASRSKRADNPAAREAYLRGRYFWNKRTGDDVDKAAYEFHRAKEIDPNYPLAYVGLADCLLMAGSSNVTTESAKDLALKAIALDDTTAEAHATLAYYLGAVEWNWVEAEREFEKSIALDPNYPTARHWHAYNLASLGRMDEAISEIRKARELDPLSVIITTDVGHILYLAERYNEAIAQYLSALQINPEFKVTRWRLGEVYAQTRRYEEAITELKKAISLDSHTRSALEIWIGQAAAINGQRREAVEILGRWNVEAEVRGQRYSIALIYAALGDVDTAFEWLEKGFKVHDGQLALIKVDPTLKTMRKDPRYTELLRRMNLPSD